MHKIKRKAVGYIKKISGSYPVVSIVGPRQSGKTTLARSFFKKLDYVNLEDPQTREFALNDPKGFLSKYPNGVILDEIQRCPDLPSYIQVLVDEETFKGQFVLTGSQNFSVLNTLSQSLAGRVSNVVLLPFCLKETTEFTKLKNLNHLIYTGFYPRIFHKKLNPYNFYSDYVLTYLERDLRQLQLIKDLSTFQRFLKLIATRVDQLIDHTSLSKEVGINIATVRKWLVLLEASYIIFFLPPFYKNMGKRITKRSKLYFYDIGLASYLLGIINDKQVDSHPLRGNLFENMVVSEILKQTYNNGGVFNFYFYQDSNKTEVDLLIPDSHKYSLVEIKASSTWNSGFRKGFDSFERAYGEHLNKTLIYSGSENIKINHINLVSFNSSFSIHKIVDMR